MHKKQAISIEQISWPVAGLPTQFVVHLQSKSSKPFRYLYSIYFLRLKFNNWMFVPERHSQLTNSFQLEWNDGVMRRSKQWQMSGCHQVQELGVSSRRVPRQPALGSGWNSLDRGSNRRHQQTYKQQAMEPESMFGNGASPRESHGKLWTDGLPAAHVTEAEACLIWSRAASKSNRLPSVPSGGTLYPCKFLRRYAASWDCQ